MTHIRMIDLVGNAPAEYVQLLGTNQQKDPGPWTSITVSFTPVTMAADESVFVALGFAYPASPLTGTTVTDDLGNTYTNEGEDAHDARQTFLFAARPSVAGSLSSITGTFTSIPAGYPNVIVAGRFRNVGAAEATTLPIASGKGSLFGEPGQGFNQVLTQAGSAGGIGITAKSVATTGVCGYNSPATIVGTDSTSGGADSSNITLGLGFDVDIPAAGILADLTGGQDRQWSHIGGAYAAAS